LPLGPGLAPSSTFWIVGHAEDQQLKEDWPVRRVSAGYFSALLATLVRGRYFTEEEVAAVRPVVIINETAARRYFPGEDSMGRSITFGNASFLLITSALLASYVPARRAAAVNPIEVLRAE
jgi:ABC-type antimicrobial peptide transport system permease subunit